MTDFILKYRWFIIGFCIILGISFIVLIPFSETDPEIRNYVPSKMNSRIETDKIETEFGVQDIVMLIFTDSSILTNRNLQQIKDIDRDISKLTNVASRISPFTTRTIRNSEGMMIVDPLIRRIPSEKDTAGFNQLKSDILDNRFARDIVISSDMTSASITATISDAEPETVTIQKIDSIINAHTGDTRVLKGGLPYIRQHIMRDVQRDAIILVPLALIVMLLILKFALGEWKSVFIPFSVVVLSTGLSMGMIPLLGWKMSIITLLVPVLLISIANNYGIYLVAGYQDIRLRGEGASGSDIVRELTGSLNVPILFSGLTTIAGILGLLVHSIKPARQMGVLAATGVTTALIMSLIFIPALISLRRKSVPRIGSGSTRHGNFNRFFDSLSGMIIKYPGRIILVTGFITLIFVSGIFLLKIETNQENYFPKKNPVRQASEVINMKFGGSQTISVMISGDIKDPSVMKG
ncbi:MAG: MMPL family transporter, partial [Bacteroidales bacterium]|nr:MMPL family transporter [Bacteroidales bacterium]